MAQGEKIIGIDLGTTNSVVAVMEGKEAYDKALKEYQEKKLTKDINNFIKDYPFCKVRHKNRRLWRKQSYRRRCRLYLLTKNRLSA